MCAVFSRKRNISDLQFYATAKDIRKYLTRFVMNEKHIPKKYRYVFSIPMAWRKTSEDKK